MKKSNTAVVGTVLPRTSARTVGDLLSAPVWLSASIMIAASGNPDGAAPGTTLLLVTVTSLTTVFAPERGGERRRRPAEGDPDRAARPRRSAGWCCRRSAASRQSAPESPRRSRRPHPPTRDRGVADEVARYRANDGAARRLRGGEDVDGLQDAACHRRDGRAVVEELEREVGVRVLREAGVDSVVGEGVAGDGEVVAGVADGSPIRPVSWVWTSSARCGELLANVLPVMLAAVVTAVPDISNRNALAPVVSFRLLKLLPVTLNDVIVPEVFRMCTLLCALPLTLLFAIETVPVTPTVLPRRVAELDALVGRAVAVVGDVAAVECEVRNAEALDARIGTVLDVHVAQADVAGRVQADPHRGRALNRPA